MDKKFTYVVCVVAYIIMVVCLFTGSEFRVRYTFVGYTRTSWFILYSIGYTLEFIGLVFGVHVASSRAEAITESLCEQNEKINEMHTSIIMGFAGLVESRDTHTGLHVKRTAEVVKLIMMSMEEIGLYKDELNKESIRNIEMAAPLHDIGKIVIPDSILCKPGKFTDEEYNEMKKHAGEGKNIIDRYLSGMEEIDFIKTAGDIA
jgi:response regulator RpfG family c-di-GMP phosphodiesterase